jgi:hypothetical protein
MCHFERIVTAPIAKQCNTQEKRTTKKFFHCTLLFLREITSPCISLNDGTKRYLLRLSEVFHGCN